MKIPCYVSCITLYARYWKNWGAVRAAAHEDICLLTLLPASNEPGLQVLKRDGSWLNVPAQAGHFDHQYR